MATLTCDTCTALAEDARAAIAHVTVNPNHKMAGKGDAEGTTLTVSIDYGDYGDDEYGQNLYGDCATCDGGGCGDCA